ncbi:MAG: 3-dehydroquinate synthase, partial [Planctomycetota bacterium]
VAEAEKIWNEMLSAHTDRGSAVIAVGGGVVGDLAGFMAATFARGIPLVQIPTTLLSQVDSSVGGKTGINLPGAKNIVGAFWQPSIVLIDSKTLSSLPEREYISGLAEVAKYGVILLPELFEYLEEKHEAVLAKDPGALEHIILESCRAKAQVVKEDERETSGLRAILNYGHTFAHALESITGYGTLLHGEAVAIGMHMAANMAEKMGRIESALVNRQQNLLQKLQLPTQFLDADPEAMWQVMQHDKKVEHGKLRFILPTKLGHVELVDGVEKDVATSSILAANS